MIWRWLVWVLIEASARHAKDSMRLTHHLDMAALVAIVLQQKSEQRHHCQRAREQVHLAQSQMEESSLNLFTSGLNTRLLPCEPMPQPCIQPILRCN